MAWNVHEPERGRFVFQDQLDLRYRSHVLLLLLFSPSNISLGNTNIAMLILFNWIRRYCPQGLHQPSSRAGTVGDSASRTLYLCWMGSGRSTEVTPSGCYFRGFPKHICSHPPLLCFFQLVVTRWRYALEDNLSEIRGGCQSLLWQAHFSDKAVDGEFNSKFWNLSVGLNGEKHFPCFSQFEEGGPIIGVQLENEYGSFAKDNNYMPFIKDVSFPLATMLFVQAFRALFNQFST